MGRTLRTRGRWLARGRFDLLRTFRAVRHAGVVDPAYYLAANADVARAGFDPVAHYVEYGAAEGRQPADVTGVVAVDVPPASGRLLPPPEMRLPLEPFELIGAEFLGHLVELADLQPHESVLDIGSGMGRMAIPLTSYLQPPGRYDGFDVIREQVEWCQENITPRHPIFRFQLVAVRNGSYNPAGGFEAAAFTFPYADASFDVILLASVFTHLLRADLEQYVAEIRRVLRPGGRALMTFFLPAQILHSRYSSTRSPGSAAPTPPRLRSPTTRTTSPGCSSAAASRSCI
jgi:hypothetical protein